MDPTALGLSYERTKVDLCFGCGEVFDPTILLLKVYVLLL